VRAGHPMHRVLGPRALSLGQRGAWQTRAARARAPQMDPSPPLLKWMRGAVQLETLPIDGPSRLLANSSCRDGLPSIEESLGASQQSTQFRPTMAKCQGSVNWRVYPTQCFCRGVGVADGERAAFPTPSDTPPPADPRAAPPRGHQREDHLPRPESDDDGGAGGPGARAMGRHVSSPNRIRGGGGRRSTSFEGGGGRADMDLLKHHQHYFYTNHDFISYVLSYYFNILFLAHKPPRATDE